MTSVATSPESADALWVAQATDAVPALATWGAAVIAARDPQVAGLVAVAIARALATTRRVAVADLIGDLPALTSLLPPDDDPHGIADSFRYGVSLNRIARAVDAAGTLFVLPSGTEAVAHEEIYRNDRWRRLAGGFTQVGASLFVVASPDVPGFDELVRYVGGLVRVGAQAPDAPIEVTHVLSIDTPAPLARAAARATDRARRTASAEPAVRRSRALSLVALVGAAIVAGVMAWPTVRDRLLPAAATSAVDSVAALTPPVPVAPAAPTVAPVADSSVAVVDSAAGATDSTATVRMTIANPADSAQAARYAVYLLAANTAASAVPAIERAARTARVGDSALANLTVSPVTFGRDSARWYRVTMGAFPARADAESLLVTLRRQRVLGETSGSVIVAPLAFELEPDVPAAQQRAVVARWQQRGVRPYLLRTSDGRVRLYAGAFESPEQATLLADSLRALGFTPPLAFRLGRSSP